MPVRERGRFKAVGTIAALAALLVAGLVLADLFVDASLRSVAVRLLAAVVLALFTPVGVGTFIYAQF